jgi:NADH-quinone oxidoreductase subunit C
MADDAPKPPASAAEPSDNNPPSPPQAAADKPAASTPAEPSGGLKAEVSRTDAPGAGVSAAPVAPPAPAAPTATSPASPTTAAPAPPKPAAPAAAKPAAAAAVKPAAPKAPAAGGADHAPKAAPPTGPPDPPPPADKAVPEFITSLQSAIPGSVTALSFYVGDWTIIVPADRILEVSRHLAHAVDAQFDFCSDLTATDWPPRAERFDVVYCLVSTRLRHRIRVKARVADQQTIASVTPVWPAANWFEREIYDMFGIEFAGHPDLRRILMPEDWQGFPQRKDYPLEGPGELLMENPLDWLKLRQAKEEADIE